MFQNAVIDIAIGLILMYLVLSLLCTVVNEYIATVLSWRAKDLQASIKDIIDNQDLRTAFYNHGLINTTNDVSGGDHASYFDGKTVAMALIGSLDTSKPIPAYADVEQAVKALPDSSIKTSLLATLTEANNDLDKLRTSIAGWFDKSMDRLSGAYKRKTKTLALVVGLIIAGAINADSLRVGITLWNDSSLRAQMVGIADDYLKACGDKCLKPDGSNLTDVQQQFKNADQTLRPLPIGWPDPTFDCRKILSWLQKIGGLLATGFALSLGAPFWFDLLSKFMKLRGTGDKPAKEKSKKS